MAECTTVEGVGGWGVPLSVLYCLCRKNRLTLSLHNSTNTQVETYNCIDIVHEPTYWSPNRQDKNIFIALIQSVTPAYSTIMKGNKHDGHSFKTIIGESSPCLKRNVLKHLKFFCLETLFTRLPSRFSKSGFRRTQEKKCISQLLNLKSSLMKVKHFMRRKTYI